MAIEFYYTGGGPFAWRCRLTLAIKKIPYRPVMLDLTKGETRTPEFLSLNPRGTLPVLKDGKIVVRESQAIMFYLDRAFPEPPLYGRTPSEAARIMQEIAEQGSYIEALLRKVIGPVLFAAGPVSAIADVAAPLDRELSALDRHLGESPYIAGDTVSAADINLYPFLPTYQRALQETSIAELASAFQSVDASYPNIVLWMKRMQALDG
jgi:glutathione S-transferase